jgi:hypothetical protein
MTEEKIRDLVLNEKGITHTTDYNDYENLTPDDYVIGEEETCDGYTFFSVRGKNAYYKPSETDGGRNAIFMYSEGLTEEVAQIIENNSSVMLYFEDESTRDDVFNNLDWELLAENIGLTIEQEEEE